MRLCENMVCECDSPRHAKHLVVERRAAGAAGPFLQPSRQRQRETRPEPRVRTWIGASLTVSAGSRVTGSKVQHRDHSYFAFYCITKTSFAFSLEFIVYIHYYLILLILCILTLYIFTLRMPQHWIQVTCIQVNSDGGAGAQTRSARAFSTDEGSRTFSQRHLPLGGRTRRRTTTSTTTPPPPTITATSTLTENPWGCGPGPGARPRGPRPGTYKQSKRGREAWAGGQRAAPQALHSWPGHRLPHRGRPLLWKPGQNLVSGWTVGVFDGRLVQLPRPGFSPERPPPGTRPPRLR